MSDTRTLAIAACGTIFFGSPRPKINKALCSLSLDPLTLQPAASAVLLLRPGGIACLIPNRRYLKNNSLAQTIPRVRHPLSLFPCNQQHLNNLRHARKFLGSRPRASPYPENVQTLTILLGVGAQIASRINSQPRATCWAVVW